MGYGTDRPAIVDLLIAVGAFIVLTLTIFVVVTLIFNAVSHPHASDAGSVIPPTIEWVQVTAPAGFDVTCFGQVFTTVFGEYVYNNIDSQIVVCIPNAYRSPE